MKKNQDGKQCHKEFTYVGKLVGVNRWHGARMVRRQDKLKPSLFENEDYRNFKTDFAYQAAMAMKPIDRYLDATIYIWMWKVRDTDGVIKPILDALQQGGIIKDDKFIRNITIIRGYHKKSEKDMVALFLSPLNEYETALVEDQQLKGYKT